MKSLLREEDTVARLGGDEFIVILPEIRDREDALAVAGKLLEAFHQPFHLEGLEIFVGLSIGIAVSPDDGDHPEALMRNADVAMYQAKDEGRGTVRPFSPELSERAHRRIRLEAQLRGALGRDELSLHYQPLLDVRTERIVGAEALLRWRNADLGNVPPDQFIGVAEDTGLILPIGEWVLATACTQARAWRDGGLGPIDLAINVSSRQFRGGAIVDAIHAVLAEYDLPPGSLELEITERLLMDDRPDVAAVLAALAELGVRLSIDDFGTGYLSLSYLNRFRLHTLKIDRSFTAQILESAAQKALVDAMIVMAHRLGMRVIAEGVETREQFLFLKERECDVVQGYFFSRPLPAQDFARLLGRPDLHLAS
jgi:predicted signal transduction protein with EAL and GGDEF domain